MFHLLQSLNSQKTTVNLWPKMVISNDMGTCPVRHIGSVSGRQVFILAIFTLVFFIRSLFFICFLFDANNLVLRVIPLAVSAKQSVGHFKYFAFHQVRRRDSAVGEPPVESLTNFFTGEDLQVLDSRNGWLIIMLRDSDRWTGYLEYCAINQRRWFF